MKVNWIVFPLVGVAALAIWFFVDWQSLMRRAASVVMPEQGAEVSTRSANGLSNGSLQGAGGIHSSAQQAAPTGNLGMNSAERAAAKENNSADESGSAAGDANLAGGSADEGVVASFNNVQAQVRALSSSFLRDDWVRTSPESVRARFAALGIATKTEPAKDAEGITKRLVTSGLKKNAGFASFAESYHWMSEGAGARFSHARAAFPMAVEGTVDIFSETETAGLNAGWKTLKKDSLALRMEKDGWELMLNYHLETAAAASESTIGGEEPGLPGVPNSFNNELTIIFEQNEH